MGYNGNSHGECEFEIQSNSRGNTFEMAKGRNKMKSTRYAIFCGNERLTDWRSTRGACYFIAFGMGWIKNVEYHYNTLKEGYCICEIRAKTK